MKNFYQIDYICKIKYFMKKVLTKITMCAIMNNVELKNYNTNFINLVLMLTPIDIFILRIRRCWSTSCATLH